MLKTSWRFWIALVIKSFEGTTRPLYLKVDIVRNFIIFEKDKVTIKKLPRIINTGQRIKHLNRL
jgi:hypothetical protein